MKSLSFTNFTRLRLPVHDYHETLLEIFQLNAIGKIFFQTSTLTLLEVLVQPIKLQKLNLAS